MVSPFLYSSPRLSIPTNQQTRHSPNQLLFPIMHANTLIALALGATAVSAASLPDLQVRQSGACDPSCNFPNSMYCSGNGGALLQRDQIIALAENADRSGPPREQNANNLASGKCAGAGYDFPLWIANIPGENGSVGDLYYALAPNNTFYFCSTSSGTLPSGWAAQCEERA
ncbi:hypothetical protein J1614_011081 [Plenodomus biglobosus]|nr:hypothetical protein J1614_011081 [Plenodomus biglobosus]